MKILSFDIEEWFHILDHESTRTKNEWKNYEVRIHENVERILNMLEQTNQRATFFCLGWIAETYPEIIREIVNRGFEIGSHGRMHQLVYQQSPKVFENDLEYSIKTLEDVAGQKIKYYRAPGFSIKEDSKWAFEILSKYGIEVVCSIFPAPRAHGGFPSYNEPIPSIIKGNDFAIKELPISYTKILGKPIIFSGGGYFRFFPYPLIKRWNAKSEYLMVYLHPRDFDVNQPMIPDLNLIRKFKCYVGLKKSEIKFRNWLLDDKFIDVSTAIKQINWSQSPVVDISTKVSKIAPAYI